METVLYTAHPAMFRSHPFRYALCVILIAAFGLGLVILLIWWVRTRGTTLTVTDMRVTLRTGILSRHVTEVRNREVANIQIDQTMMQRIMRVGKIGISTAAETGIEIVANGIPEPDKVKDLIDQSGEITSPPRR